MSVVNMFANTSEAYQQVVQSDYKKIKEYNSPGWNAFRNNVEKRKVGEKGLKVVLTNITSGGHSTPTASRPDWNEPVADEDLAMYIYSVRYRLPFIFDHALIRDARNKIPSAPGIMKNRIENKTIAAMKRLERAFYLDGKGSVAYSLTTTSTLGSQTLTGDTTPATTAGHTKGTKWLQKNNWYQAINETTGLPRGLFQVTAVGATTCTINLVSGSISSGDPIVDVNTYTGFFRGLAWLISKANRTIQGVNTADVPDLNSWGIDLAGSPMSFNAIEDMLTGLKIRNNDGNKNGKVIFIPPGQTSVLRKSGQNFRVYNDGSNVVQGIAEDIDFGTNITAISPSDLDEDRVYAVVYNEFGMLEEMELDEMTMDGQTWHQLMGANNSGSERYQGGIGWDGNFYRKGNAQSSAYLYRASTSGVYQQTSV